MEKRRTTTIAKIVYYGELVVCINIVCSCVADNQQFNQTCCFRGGFSRRISVADFRGGLPVADFRGGFPWRISVADFRGGFSVADFRGGFAWRILRSGFPWRICLADLDFVFFLAADLRRILVNHAADFAADFCGGFFQVQNPVNYTSKSHRKSTTKIHRILHRMLA